jgi:hypothetical protein
MPKTEINPTSLEYVYKEYVRLSERCASYVQSSFDDIKLYGVSGLAFAWKPIVDYLKLNQTDKSPVLFYGFLTILLVVIILGIFNLLKQSLVIYYLRHLRAYETEIRADLGEINKVAFEWTESYSEWRKKIVIRIFLHLQIVVCLAVIVFPIVILAYVQKAYLYAAIYLSVSVFLLFIYGHAARALLKE